VKGFRAARRARAGVLGAGLLAVSAARAAGAAGASEGLAALRVRSGPGTEVREVVVRGGGSVQFAALLQQGSGGDRARLGFAVPLAGGRLHAGALRAAEAGIVAPGKRSLFRLPWPAVPSLSLAGSAEGLAWVGRAAGAAWVRRSGEAPAVAGWISGRGVRVAGRSGPAAAGRLDARGWWGARLALHVDRGGPAGLLALVAPEGAVGLGYAGEWDARVGLRGRLARGRWRAEGTVAWSDPARSDVRAEWNRREGGGELRLSARVNRKGDAVRSAGRVGLEVRIARGAVGGVAAERGLTGRAEASAGLELRRRSVSVQARVSLPERSGRRLDLRVALGSGRLRGRLRVRVQLRRGPEAELALTRHFALTSPGGRDTMRRFGEARD